MANIGPNMLVTVDRWNEEIARTEFLELGESNQVPFPGILNIYDNFPFPVMEDVASSPARYLERRNIRSNNFSSFVSGANASWKLASEYGNSLNLYSLTLQNGRLDYDITLGEIYSDIDGIYLIYAEMIIPSAPSNNLNHTIALYQDGSSYAYATVPYPYIVNTPIYIQLHALSLFTASTWTLYWRGTTAPNPDMTVRFGYTQLIGVYNDSATKCGAI